MRCGLVVKYKLVRKYHAHLSHIPHCSYDVFSTIKRVTSCSSVYCNISSHTVVVIELAWWQSPLYIIGGGTVRYSSAKQRTFGLRLQRCASNCMSQRLSQPPISICPNIRHALTTRLEAVSLTWATLRVVVRPKLIFWLLLFGGSSVNNLQSVVPF